MRMFGKLLMFCWMQVSCLGYANTLAHCVDPQRQLCIEIRGDRSISDEVNIGIRMFALSENPLWNEYGRYSNFISPNTVFPTLLPVDYLKQRKFVYVEYTIDRIGQQTVLDCAYQAREMRPEQFRFKLSRDETGRYHCQTERWRS